MSAIVKKMLLGLNINQKSSKGANIKNAKEDTKENTKKNLMELKTFARQYSGASGAGAVWSGNCFSNFAQNYNSNTIAYRCVNLIARSASYVGLNCYDENSQEIVNCKITNLFKKPNSMDGYSCFMEKLYSSLLISGNIFILINKCETMEILKSDKVSILIDKNDNIIYRYKKAEKEIYDFPRQKDGKCQILHIKYYNPLNEHYGLSPFEVAKFAIEQHNESSNFNKALLQNFARPSGALIVNTEGEGLSENQYLHLKEQISENFSGKNNGRPLILEGNMDWREMSISPKDMDFMESRNSCSREIALAFGVPSQLLGIQGDNTYANMSQARLALWEQTIIPLINFVVGCFNDHFTANKSTKETPVSIQFDKDAIATLSSSRDSEWEKLSRTTFLTINEKRQLLGFDNLPNGDVLEQNNNFTTPQSL